MGGKSRQTTVIIWHNKRCSTSRKTLELLREHGVEPEIREYLTSAPTADEIEEVLKKLGMEPRALLRKKEGLYKELGLEHEEDPNALIQAMAEHPVLIERPVVIRGRKAALGRPPEQVLAVLA